MIETIKVGDKVIAKNMPVDSFYKQIIGTVTEGKGSWVNIQATHVMSKWDDELTKHPTGCSTGTLMKNVQKI